MTAESLARSLNGRAVPGSDPTALATAAQWYVAHGIPVFPLAARGKTPLTVHGFYDASTDAATIGAWWDQHPDANIGVPTGAVSGLLVIDCDPRNGGPATRAEFLEQFGSLSATAEAITGGGGRHFFFRHPGGPVPKTLAPGIDVKGDGGYIVVAPSVHPNGNRYEWDGIAGARALLTPADPPAWLTERIADQSNAKSRTANPIKPTEKWKPGERNNQLTSIAGTMRRRGMSVDAIRVALLEENRRRCEPPLRNGEVEQIAESVGRYAPATSCATAAVPAVGAVDLLSPPFNDYGNGQRIIAAHGEDMRYCHSFRAWLVWTGTHWAIDRTDKARKMAQQTMLEFARQAMASSNDAAAKFAGSCLNSNRITAALREAEPHLAVTVDQLDTDPDLLNCANGTVDLRTGTLREHRRDNLITKIVPYAYNPSAKCPTWHRTIDKLLPGLRDHLQKAFGYTLTARTSEKVVFVCYGSGNNGKTTLLGVFREVIGDYYAVLLQIDSLMARTIDNNSQADLADLRGARFVMTSETEEGQRLAEGRLKRITQGMGRIKAVRKYENPVEFAETHKLWLDCNHKPIVRGNDQAIWNRLHLIPFAVTISAAEIDRDLPAKLLAEAEGILAWAVAGAVRWYREGLGKPDAVESAGREWRSEMDQLGRYVEECCVTGEPFRTSASALYSDYRRWSETAGEHPLSSTAFGLRLKERGFEKKTTERGVVYLGIALRASDQERAA